MINYDYPPAYPRRNRHRAAWGLVITGLVLLAIVALIVGVKLSRNDPRVIPDSGVAYCQQISDRQNGNGGPTMDFAKARSQFQSSRFEDLKIAGTSLVDTLQKAQWGGGESLQSSVSTYTEIQSRWSSLQTACENHGVAVPDLPKG